MNRNFLQQLVYLALGCFVLASCENKIKVEKNEFPVYLSVVNTSGNKDIKLNLEDADSINLLLIPKGKGSKVYPVLSFAPNKLLGKAFSVVDSQLYHAINFELAYKQKDTISLFAYEDQNQRLRILPIADKFLRFVPNEDSQPGDTALVSLRIFNPDVQNDTLLYTLKQNNVIVGQLRIPSLAHQYLLIPPGELSVIVSTTSAIDIAIQDGLKLSPTKRYELYQNSAISGNVDSLKAGNNPAGVVLLRKNY